MLLFLLSLKKWTRKSCKYRKKKERKNWTQRAIYFADLIFDAKVQKSLSKSTIYHYVYFYQKCLSHTPVVNICTCAYLHFMEMYNFIGFLNYFFFQR